MIKYHIYRNSNVNTLCILEGIAESTNPLEGKMIFSNFLNIIKSKTIVITTNYGISEFIRKDEYIKTMIYEIIGGVQRILDDNTCNQNEESEICNEFKEYIQMINENI